MDATELRIQWMRGYGLDETEIQQSLIDDPPTSIEVEQVELDAIRECNEIIQSDEEGNWYCSHFDERNKS